MKVGVIFCGWGTKDLVNRSLAPWINMREKVVICAVSVRFANFDGNDDGTREILRGYHERGEIDHIIDGPDNIPETTARGMALNWLKNQDIDLVIQWDSDEVTHVPALERMLGYIDANPFSTWYRFSYANLVFDEKTRLSEPFTPPRAFRIKVHQYEAHSFGGDNDIWYGGTFTRDIISSDRFPSMIIPETIFCPKHYTWLQDTPERAVRSKAKTIYQARRWGDRCSFIWDDSQGGLVFNPALPKPKVLRDFA